MSLHSIDFTPRFPAPSHAGHRPRLGLVATGLSLLLAATACEADGLHDGFDDAAAEEEPEAEPRIHGGVVTEDVDLRAVVEVRTYEIGGPTTHCTGTLISEDVVLTAAHCVCDGIDATSCKPEATVFFSGLGVQDDPNTYFDESNPFYHGDVVAHPSYYAFGNTVQHDVALIQLHFPFGDDSLISMVDPIDVASTDPSVGQSVELVGFGWSNEACDANRGVKRKTTMSVTNTSGVTFTVSDTDAHTCPGDSGGPALDSQGRLRGVLSTKSGSVGNYTSRYMGIEYYRPFIAQNTCDWDEVPVSMWDECANPLCPCAATEGDCDSNAECAGALVCTHDVGASYGLPSTADVCEDLADPSLHIEFVGCDGWSPKFIVDWGHSGGELDAYDVDRKEGFGSYQAHYDGPSGNSQIYWGSSGRNDAFRVRVCRGTNCGPFVSKSTGSWSCDGNNPPEPL